TIPDWAYRDVLFMLIHYSIASFELLERKLSLEEKEEVFDVFYRVGAGMGLKDLPLTYKEWLLARESHLQNDLQKTGYTTDLFNQYHKHLGAFRYFLLIQGQKLVVPGRVKELLGLGSVSLIAPVLRLYKLSRLIRLDWFLKSAVLPKKYKAQIKDLDQVPLRKSA
ncbi:MAG TPA: hypothetical protein VNS32_17800, partial [Flavisolibacter sp.]|nr:hypothetical protein [Flavisolibacter sp.]